MRRWQGSRAATSQLTMTIHCAATQWVERAHTAYVELQRESHCAIESSRRLFERSAGADFGGPKISPNQRFRGRTEEARTEEAPSLEETAANARSDHCYGHE